MATSASRSRLFPARSRKSYRLEMESRTLYLLLSLMVLTGVVIFYLGVVTGKALRDPNAPVPLATQMGTPGAAPPEAAKPTDLAFADALKGDRKDVEGLRSAGQQSAKRTEALLSAAEKQLKLEEVTPSRPAAATAPKPAETPNVTRPQATQSQSTQSQSTQSQSTQSQNARPRVSRPPAAPADDGMLYTVQVFSSQSQERARALMNRLVNQGFPAYLNRYEAADKQVWYRVRVGKMDHSAAESLSERLRTEAKLKNPQVHKL